VAERTRLIDEIPRLGAQRHPDRAAIVTPDGEVTFQQLADRVDTMAANLAEFGQPSDRVAVIGANSIDYVVTLYAVPKAGRTLAFVNQRLHQDEQLRLIEQVEASTVLGDETILEPLRATSGNGGLRWQPFSPADGPEAAPFDDPPDVHGVAWLIHTSGTTGTPKGVPLTHRNLRMAIEVGQRGRPVGDNDVYLFPFPLCHVAAYNVLLQHDQGATVVLPPGFDARATLDDIARLGVTTMSLAPTMIVRLLDALEPDDDLASLRSIGYGAAPLPVVVRERATKALGCTLVEGYGMTELAGNAVFDGRPDPAIELRVVDEAGEPVENQDAGEIEARGPQVVGGYWRDATATEAAFHGDWFRTGDIGRWTSDGRLTIVDRSKDIIITGGENVASREVEDVVAAHPDVAAVAVVGAPDAEWGERIVAVVVPRREMAEDVLAASIVTHSRSHLAGFKTPRQIEFVTSLPVNASGKVDKRALRSKMAI
jgi:acyl-CoA synthetase (AMP-forming)/AMP-acid ligase II